MANENNPTPTADPKKPTQAPDQMPEKTTAPAQPDRDEPARK
jgi:hypothetical protein